MKKLSIILAFIMSLCLFSCGGENSEEVLGDFAAIAPRATNLYRIIYTDGLPHGETGEDGYAAVSEGAEFSSIEEIEEALAEVFYSDYCKILENTAFLGVYTAEGEIKAKFIERDGVLYVAPSVTEHFGEPRDFDISEAEVVKKNRYMATVLVPHPDGDLEVSLQNTENGWKINSPLY